jgi:hypothetical protein
MSVIRQARRMVRQHRNYAAMATAQMHRTYVSAHLEKGAKPPDLTEFLPCPAEWQLFKAERTLNISRLTALDILSNYEYLDFDVKQFLEPYLSEIEATLQA